MRASCGCPSVSWSVWANAWLAGRAAPTDVIEALSLWAPRKFRDRVWGRRGWCSRDAVTGLPLPDMERRGGRGVDCCRRCDTAYGSGYRARHRPWRCGARRCARPCRRAPSLCGLRSPPVEAISSVHGPSACWIFFGTGRTRVRRTGRRVRIRAGADPPGRERFFFVTRFEDAEPPEYVDLGAAEYTCESGGPVR